jgi:alpha-methylacyl-CoA racemase
MAEAPEHPHAKARGSFVNLDGIVQPAPGPRYSITELCGPQSPRHVSLDDILCG